MDEVSVYQSDLTGHWIVDQHGTKEYPSPRREGFRKREDAQAEANRLTEESNASYARIATWGWPTEIKEESDD